MGKIKNRRRLHNKAAKAVKAAGEDGAVKETPFGSFAEPVLMQPPEVKSKVFS